MIGLIEAQFVFVNVDLLQKFTDLSLKEPVFSHVSVIVKLEEASRLIIKNNINIHWVCRDICLEIHF